MPVFLQEWRWLVSSEQNIVPFQCHAPEDPAALRRQLQEHLAQLEQIKAGPDGLATVRLIGLIGEEYRFLGALKAALPLLEEALAGAQRLGERHLEVVNCIRLATTYQYTGRHTEAEALAAIRRDSLEEEENNG